MFAVAAPSECKYHILLGFSDLWNSQRLTRSRRGCGCPSRTSRTPVMSWHCQGWAFHRGCRCWLRQPGAGTPPSRQENGLEGEARAERGETERETKEVGHKEQKCRGQSASPPARARGCCHWRDPPAGVLGAAGDTAAASTKGGFGITTF